MAETNKPAPTPQTKTSAMPAPANKMMSTGGARSPATPYKTR